ncbi:hypothetical protein [Cupriavidus basilensis]|nr:hypothetical protein [Cupriavidus basilensis]
MEFRFKEQFDGYMLAVLDEGSLEYETSHRWHERAGRNCLMIDGPHAMP